jgi:hypothetical protein
MKRCAIALLAITAACSQTKEPKVTDTQLKRLFKAAQVANPYLQELEAAKKDILATCNVPGWEVYDDQTTGEPACRKKAEAPKTDAKKK